MVNRKLQLAVAALVAGLALPAGLAAARTTATDKVTASVKRAGGSGATIIYKGTARSKLFGSGKVVEHAKIKGLGSTGTVTITYRKGTIRASTSSTAKLTLKGTATFTGTYRITGGSGAYKSISGKGTFKGEGPLDLSGASFTQKGRVSY